MSNAVLDKEAALFGVASSAMGCRWRLRDANERDVLAIMQQCDTPEVVARVLAGRGITLDTAPDFLEPTLRQLLPDPSHLLDMDVAAQRFARAITSQETIAIFGDYDVDGATSSALLVRYLRALGCEPLVHIPDRMAEGYGPNAPALLELQAKGASLVITVDCGAVSYEPLAAAHEAGLDVIVVDHHIGNAALPKAVAVVNPNRFDETSPHRHLAAVGVAFLLVVATNRLLKARGRADLPNPLQWLDLVALGTVCDVVALTGVNRAFVAQGLKVLSQRQNLGLATLCDLSRMDGAPSTYHLGFLLGPRINAGGRVGKADMGVRLLTTYDPAETLALAQQLDQYNNERKTLEALALEEAVPQAEIQQDDTIICVGGNWHPGVIGIVAGRLKERFHKPVAVIAWEGDVGKASARSVTGVDLGAVVVAARAEELILAGGGHAMAAGFTVMRDRMAALQAFLCERLQKSVERYTENRTLFIDSALSSAGASVELLHRLKAAEPYGMGNATPCFAFADVRLVKLDVVGEQHLRCILVDGGVGGKAAGTRLQAIAFRAVGTPLEAVLAEAYKGKRLHVAGQLRLNSWQGAEQVNLHIEDVALAG